jgi:HEAT repeat protein
MRLNCPFATGMCLLVLAAVGCGERPLQGMLDPWSRKAWKEDERFGPTFYTKREELRAMRKDMRSRGAGDQERLALDLAERLKNEQHPVLRSEIIRTLGTIPSPTASQALVAATTDADADVRVVACDVWGKRGGDEARHTLVQVLGSDTDPDVRMAATRELRHFKNDPQAMQALKLALDENNPALQFRAVESLRDMTGKDYGTDMIAWKEFIDGGNPPEPPPASIAEMLRDYRLY